jgi:hypothetical protein
VLLNTPVDTKDRSSAGWEGPVGFRKMINTGTAKARRMTGFDFQGGVAEN